MNEIQNVIRTMGITAKYRGYYYVVEAVEIALKNENTPIMITKDIYPPIASHHKLQTKSIERAIRTVVENCWSSHRETLEKLAGYSMVQKPTNSEFVDAIAYYIRSSSQEKSLDRDGEDATKAPQRKYSVC